MLAEALICHVPVVSTDCPTGPREIMNIEGLNEPTTEVIRIKTGSLLPMLNAPTDNILRLWTDEITYWLNEPVPDAEDFNGLTKRFTLDAMLNQWKAVIENKPGL